MNKEHFNILVIDDNPAIHQDFKKILQNEVVDDAEFSAIESALFGKENKPTNKLPTFKVDSASQGQEGVEKICKALAEESRYALAFVDIRMPPGWDGVKTIKQIWEKDPEIQIVICTAYSDYTWENIIAEIGLRDNFLILKKPFDAIVIRQLTCALTNKWQLHQEVKAYTNSLEARVMDRTKALEYQATHDNLTGLPSRALLIAHINQMIEKAKQSILALPKMSVNPSMLMAVQGAQGEVPFAVKLNWVYYLLSGKDKVREMVKNNEKHIEVNTLDLDNI